MTFRTKGVAHPEGVTLVAFYKWRCWCTEATTAFGFSDGRITAIPYLHANTVGTLFVCGFRMLVGCLTANVWIKSRLNSGVAPCDVGPMRLGSF